MNSPGLRVVAAVLACLCVAGCTEKIVIPEPPVPQKKDYDRQLPPGAPALRLIEDPALLPDFRAAWRTDRDALLTALDHSIRYFTYPSSRRYYPIQGITHERAAQSLIAFREILAASRSGSEFSARVLSAFDVYQSVGCDNRGTVLFTGYYTPIFDASRVRTEEYRWPLYKLPPDLVKDREGRCLGRRLESGALVPYYTRAEIMNGALDGHELIYLKDRFAAYICTVQGSAKLRLRDGSLIDVGYHGNNGHRYTSIGRLLLRDGRIRPEQLSLSGLMSYFDTHGDMLDDYLRRNDRYVFFRESEQEPTGSLGLPVTAYCSLATDKDIYPRGCLTYVDTRVPEVGPAGTASPMPFRRFMLDQDTGGAIRAPGRADIYIGVGDRAGRIAGWTLSEGELYYLFLKDDGRRM